MKTEPIYGYLRRSLLRCPLHEVEERISRVAAEFGGQVRRVFAEPTPSVDVLWSLILEADASMSGRLMPTFSDVAERRGVDLPRLLDPGKRRMRAPAWQALLPELCVDGGTVIVPGPRHLDGLAESRSALLQELSCMTPRVRVLFLTDGVSLAPRPEVISALVGEFVVTAFAAALEIASLKTRWFLAQAGLSYLLGDAEAVLHELIKARIPAGSLKDQMRVRLLRTAHTLVIDIRESVFHAEEPALDLVRQRCTRVVRRRSLTGGTITQAALPLDDPATALFADTVHRYQQLAAAPPGRDELW